MIQIRCLDLKLYQIYILFSFSQMSLDGVVAREPKLHFTNTGLLDFIQVIELVVCEDEVSEVHIFAQFSLRYFHTDADGSQLTHGQITSPSHFFGHPCTRSLQLHSFEP